MTTDTGDYYPMKTSGRRGQFIIINNESFDCLSKRLGTDEDATELKNVFSGLGFDVQVHKNQTANQMLQLMTAAQEFEDAEKKKGNECDCFGVAVLTHGEDKGLIYGTDGSITVDNLVQPLKGCKGLAGKPKLFFIQACRGQQLDGGMEADGAPGSSPSPPRIPIEADFLYAYSTPPGHFAWRSTRTTQGHSAGSWFIQALCEQLSTHCYSTDIVRILTRVNRYVAYERQSHSPSKPFLDGKKEVPSIVSMLTRELQFPRSS
jgi:hypothetical protein